MTYYAGTVAAVPTKNRQIYIDHVHGAWPVFQRYGCTRMVEGWGVDIPKGKVTDFYGAVDAREDETIVFAWTEWPDKQAADAAWERMQAENAMMQISEMPFDGSRMIYGGFSPVFTAGSDQTAGYIQGFALAVPERNREAYIRMASEKPGKAPSLPISASAWWKPGASTFPTARRPTSIARRRRKTAKCPCSAGPPGPTARHAMPPRRQWKRAWKVRNSPRCLLTECACSGAGSKLSSIQRGCDRWTPASPEWGSPFTTDYLFPAIALALTQTDV
jgi:Uncharacterized conserved protein